MNELSELLAQLAELIKQLTELLEDIEYIAIKRAKNNRPLAGNSRTVIKLNQ